MAGLPWFAVNADFPEHPKSVRLGRRLGNPLAWAYMVKVWAFCAQYQQDGRIDGEDAALMVEHAAGWDGERGAFLAAATDVGFIDCEDGTYVVHGWVERNSAHARKRERDNARPSAKYRNKATPPEPLQNPARGERGNDGAHPSQTPPKPRAGEVDRHRHRDHYTTGAAAPSSQAATPPAARPATAREEGEGSGTLGAFDLPSSQPTTVERLRASVSAGLGVIGPGGGGLSLGDGRKVGDLIRNAKAAVDRIGFDAVVEALVSDGQQAKAKGRAPETLTFFTRTLQGLANPEAPQPTQPRVTAPASPPAAFKKGGVCAL